MFQSKMEGLANYNVISSPRHRPVCFFFLPQDEVDIMSKVRLVYFDVDGLGEPSKKGGK
jgi:hypothetical protein